MDDKESDGEIIVNSVSHDSMFDDGSKEEDEPDTHEMVKEAKGGENLFTAVEDFSEIIGNEKCIEHS
jgi:hypothetical protein